MLVQANSTALPDRTPDRCGAKARFLSIHDSCLCFDRLTLVTKLNSEVRGIHNHESRITNSRLIALSFSTIFSASSSPSFGLDHNRSHSHTRTRAHTHIRHVRLHPCHVNHRVVTRPIGIFLLLSTSSQQTILRYIRRLLLRR